MVAGSCQQPCWRLPKHDVYTIANIMYLAYHYHLILKIKRY